MSSFNQLLFAFLQTLNINFDVDQKEGFIRPDVALILLNKWLAQNQDVISKMKKHSESETNIAHIAKQFPIQWDEKEYFENVHPFFNKESYIEYLSSINDSYKNLPIPNYHVNPIYDLPEYDKNWFKINETDLIMFIAEKNHGKDFYGLSYEMLNKVIINIELVKLITKCYNSIIQGNYVLSKEWCSANIVGKYKGGNKDEPKNFRPLMIMPILVRIFEGLISRKIHNICLERNIIDTQVQKAILKECSGIWENVFEVNMRLKEMFEKNLDSFFLFIDLKNAFGSVNYRNMLIILQKYNFCPEFSSYFERYYKNVHGIYFNDSFKWKNGLFQGSSLSNVLFLIYIDFAMKNFFQDLKGFNLINKEYDFSKNSFAFVDDIAIILSKNDDLSSIMKLMGRILSFYGFQINTNKTYFLTNDSIENIELNGIKYAKASKDFKYLGHSLFIYGNDVIENILRKVERSLFVIDSFNISSIVKIYIFYTNIFLRINRTIECYYLINGVSELMRKIFEEISFYAYRWGVKEHFQYEKYHLSHIYKNASNKLLKSKNLIEYHNIIMDVVKYGVEENKDDFVHFLMEEIPKKEILEESLNTHRKNNYFPRDFSRSCNVYSENFVAWQE